ncbi:hypothetical protein ACJX0J_002336 (mitochondrion) [Zea mays]
MPNAQPLDTQSYTDDLKKKSISIVLDIAFMNNTYKNTDVLQRPVLLALQSETDWVEKDSERFYFYSREVVGFLSFHRGKVAYNISHEFFLLPISVGDKFEYEEMAIEGKEYRDDKFTHFNRKRRNLYVKLGVSLIGVIPLHWCSSLRADVVVVLKIKISVKWQSSDSERKGMWYYTTSGTK